MVAEVEKRQKSLAAVGSNGARLSNAGYAIAMKTADQPGLARTAFRMDRALQTALAALARFAGPRLPEDAETAAVELDRYGRERATLARPDQSGALGESLKAIDELVPPFTKAFNDALAGSTDIIKAFGAAAAGGNKLDKLAATKNEGATKTQQATMATMTSETANMRLTVLVPSGTALVVGIALAWAFGRGISRPVRRMTAAMKRLAEGDT